MAAYWGANPLTFHANPSNPLPVMLVPQGNVLEYWSPGIALMTWDGSKSCADVSKTGWLSEGVGEGSCTASMPRLDQKFSDCGSLQGVWVGLGVEGRTRQVAEGLSLIHI